MKNGKAENEVSEIQEEPEEDQDENFSRVLTKYANPVVQTEGVEVQEMDESSINFFDRSANHHCYSEVEAQHVDHPALRISAALRRIREPTKQASASANVSVRSSRESACSKKAKACKK